MKSFPCRGTLCLTAKLCVEPPLCLPVSPSPICLPVLMDMALIENSGRCAFLCLLLLWKSYKVALSSTLHYTQVSSVLPQAGKAVVLLMFLCVALSLFILMCCLLRSRPSSARATPVLGQVRMAAMYYQPLLPCMFLS